MDNANLLSKNIAYIEKLIKHRRYKRNTVRRPMVWATFLLIPENVDEIVDFGRCMRTIGVDRVYFRPVFHGLVSSWSSKDKMRMMEALSTVKTKEQPGFKVIVPPEKNMKESATLSKSRSVGCLSRRIRTILEASNHGLILQPCGAYRGTGADKNNCLDVGGNFKKALEKYIKFPFSQNMHSKCDSCLDISFNRTLNFIHHVLQIDKNANFKKIELPGPH